MQNDLPIIGERVAWDSVLIPGRVYTGRLVEAMYDKGRGWVFAVRSDDHGGILELDADRVREAGREAQEGQ